MGSYEVGSGQYTRKGAAEQGAIGFGSYGVAAGVGKGSMLLASTSKYMTFSDTIYNAATNGGRFWKQGENVREVLNHCGFGTKWP